MPAAATTAEAFRARLAAGPLLLSGGLGTELRRRGVPTPLPLWSTAALTDAPDAVRRLHRDYVRAGARVVIANTFRLDRATLAGAGLEARARELAARAIALAREGVQAAAPDEPVFVAGSVGPLADCYEPRAVPDEATLRSQHGLRIGDLVAAGCDLAWIETMNTVREAAAALGAARAGLLPAVVSFVCGPAGCLLSGESLAAAAAAVEPLAPLAIGVNCCAPEAATAALEVLRSATSLPVGVYANGRGAPDPDQGWRFDGGCGDRAYVRHARRWLDLGARFVGGCCGTTPRTVRRLGRLLRRR